MQKCFQILQLFRFIYLGNFIKETKYDNYFEKVVINEFKNEPVQHEPVHAVQKSKN